MRIVITDSGVGGLSVCAYAERFVRTHGFREPVQLTFANAAPANDYGYNSMPSTAEKLATFDRFLGSVTRRHAPDVIYVACNTLSVLLPETAYVHNAVIPITGIVDTGVELVRRALEADSGATAVILATPTTIDAGAYPRRLEAHGVDRSRIVTQACPGLADVISEDREGSRTTAEIRRWVDLAIDQLPRTDTPVVACLACTHYGYRRDVFASALADAGVHATVIDPNERAIDDLFGPGQGDAAAPTSRDVDVEVVTRYALPDATVETLTAFLRDVSPRTVEAMENFVHVPDLF